METYDELAKLYYALRKNKEQKSEAFKSSDYKWVLGAEKVKELQLNANYIIKEPHLKNYLFDIEIEFDHYNPKNMRLYEDITEKL